MTSISLSTWNDNVAVAFPQKPPKWVDTVMTTVQDLRRESGKYAWLCGGSNVKTVTTLKIVAEVFTSPRSDGRTHESVIRAAEPVESVSLKWNASYVVPRIVWTFSCPTASIRRVWFRPGLKRSATRGEATVPIVCRK